MKLFYLWIRKGIIEIILGICTLILIFFPLTFIFQLAFSIFENNFIKMATDFDTYWYLIPILISALAYRSLVNSKDSIDFKIFFESNFEIRRPNDNPKTEKNIFINIVGNFIIILIVSFVIISAFVLAHYIVPLVFIGFFWLD